MADAADNVNDEDEDAGGADAADNVDDDDADDDADGNHNGG